MPMQIRRTSTANLPPTGLAEGQLGVEMASNPPRLWAGVPTTVDASGRRLLIPSSVASGATNPVTANAGDFFFNTTTGNLMYYDGAWQPVLFDAPSDGTMYARQDGAWEAVPVPVPPADVSLVPLGGRLDIVGSSPSTLIRFAAFNGGWIRINGVDYSIPATGITAGVTNVSIDGVAGQNLATSTLYYVYLFDASGTLTIDFSQTGHATSVAAGNVGTEIKAADETRSLIGMIYIGTTAQFLDQTQYRYVRSWFNRQRAITGVYFSFGPVGGDGTWYPIGLGDPAYSGNIVTFAEPILAVAQISLYTAAAPAGNNFYDLGVDGIRKALQQTATTTAVNQWTNVGVNAADILTDGHHWINVFRLSSGAVGGMAGVCSLTCLVG